MWANLAIRKLSQVRSGAGRPGGSRPLCPRVRLKGRVGAVKGRGRRGRECEHITRSLAIRSYFPEDISGAYDEAPKASPITSALPTAHPKSSRPTRAADIFSSLWFGLRFVLFKKEGSSNLEHRPVATITAVLEPGDYHLLVGIDGEARHGRRSWNEASRVSGSERVSQEER